MWHVSRIIHFLIWKKTFISDNYSTIYGFFVHFKESNKSQLSCWRTIFKHSFIWICCIFSSMWKFSAFTLFKYKSWQLSTWTFPMVWIFFPLSNSKITHSFLKKESVWFVFWCNKFDQCGKLFALEGQFFHFPECKETLQNCNRFHYLKSALQWLISC